MGGCAVSDPLTGWQVARRHGVPASMVAAVAERRAAGDWLGACVAARFTVGIDLATTARHYGLARAEAVEDDLLHFAPDLLRWHLPRVTSDGLGLLRSQRTEVLAVYPGNGAALQLRVRTPSRRYHPQRLRLELVPGPRTLPAHLWDLARFRWDVRHTDELLRFAGGGERAPFFHRDGRPRRPDELPVGPPPDGDVAALTEWITILQDTGRVAQAWRAAGFDRVPPGPDLPPIALTSLLPLVSELDGAALVMLSEQLTDAQVLRLTVGPAQRRAEVVPGQLADGLLVPDWWSARLPDLELLRHNRIGLAQLHPAVRAALFPDAPADTGPPAGPTGPAPTGPAPTGPVPTGPAPTGAAPTGPVPGFRPLSGHEPPQPVRVRCDGQWHLLGWGPGGLVPLSHTTAEIVRERAMAVLGGAPHGCFAVITRWRGARGRLPRSLRAMRAHLNRAVLHGDADEVERWLSAGVNPVGLRTEFTGRTMLHRIAWLDRSRIVDRLVAAGAAVEERDPTGKTPLQLAVEYEASIAVIHALLAVGADPSGVRVPPEADQAWKAKVGSLLRFAPTRPDGVTPCG